LLPNTLVSLVITVALLLPGYTFVRRRQLDLPSRDRTALDEVASVVFAGVAIDTTVAVAFLGLHKIASFIPPDVDQLVDHPSPYVRQHYTELAISLAVLVLIATVLAYALSAPRFRKLATRFWGGPPHSHQSTWWLLFSQQHPSAGKYVSCVLDDGALIRGNLFSFSRASREHADRELVLTQPLQYRPGPDDPLDPLPGVGAVSVSSRRVVLLMVSYMAQDKSAPSNTETQSAERSGGD